MSQNGCLRISRPMVPPTAMPPNFRVGNDRVLVAGSTQEATMTRRCSLSAFRSVAQEAAGAPGAVWSVEAVVWALVTSAEEG